MRETKLIIVSGRKRIGKSNETLRYLFRDYTRGLNARKVLIYDPNNEYGAYELYEGNNKSIIKVPILGHNDILKYNKQKRVEIRRIVPVNEYGIGLTADEQDELVVKIMSEFRGGCLWIEDLSTVFGDALPKRVSGFFTNNAHRDCDIILQLQTVARILPKMWGNTNAIRFHKQLDSIDQSEKKLKEFYPLFKITQIMVDNQYNNGNIRYFLWVDMDDLKIRGNYSMPMFRHAVKEYLLERPSFIKKEVNRLKYSGAEKCTNSDAINSLVNRLIKEYYGNKLP